MDIATIVGLVIGIACCIIGIISSGGVTAFGNFVDPASFIVTFGGAFGCMLTQAKSIPEMGKCIKTISLAFKVPKADEVNVIENIIRLSNIARKEGLLALEEAANDVDDEFLKKGIMLIVDGTDPELVYQAIRGGLAGSTVLDAKAPMMMDRNFKPGFRIELHIKDLNNALNAGHAVSAPLPLTGELMEIMQALKADGHEKEDHSSIVKFYEKIGNVTVTRD